MSKLAVILALLMAGAALTGCAEPADNGGTPTTPGGTTTPTATPPDATPTQASPPPTPTGDAATDAGEVRPMFEGEYRATIRTSKGDIVVELYEDKAPLSVANFLQYAQDDHYANTVFHRIAKGFVIQGGGFEAPFEGTSPPRPTHGPIPVEMWEGATHATGTLGMARTNDPNSGTSQWFINTNDNSNLDAGYTVFGRVVEGMDVVRAIESVPTTTKGGFQNVPTEDVVIQEVTVETPDAPPELNLAAFRSSYGVAPGGSASFPVFVKNVGGMRVEPQLAGSASGGATVTVERAPGALSPGQAGVAIVRVEAPEGFEGGRVTVESANGAGGHSRVTLGLEPLDASGPAAGDEHPKVSAHYIGLYDNGVVFDTTATSLDERGFPMPTGFNEHPTPLQVWVGPEGGDTGDHNPVIPGFKSGIVGLREGETRTVHLTSEEGYNDGRVRIFEMHVASIDA